MFVKIPGDKEQPSRLTKLKELLMQHSGDVPIVLYYERTNKVLALKDEYRVQPSSELIRMIEAIMGQGTVRIQSSTR